MAPLLQTNSYLRKASERAAMLVRNAVESSVFEGARGLKIANKPQTRPAPARRKASAK